VAVVGSGLPALATALEIARRGSSVTVVGSPPAVAARGLGLVLLGLGRPYSVVARELGRSAAQLLWAAGCENHLRLRALLEETGKACDYRPRGSFLLGGSRAEAEQLAESEDMLRDDGFRGEFLDHYMLETRFDVSGFPGAYWAAEDAEIDVPLLLEAVASAAQAAGVGFGPGSVRGLEVEPTGIVVDTDQGPVRGGGAVVAGPSAAALLPELGPLLRPVAPQRLRAALPPGPALPTAGRTADGRHAWQTLDDRIVLAETGLGDEPAREPAMDLSVLAARFHVDATGAERWEESDEASADGWPVVGRLAERPVAVTGGFSAFAPSLAFAAARWVADALLSELDPTPEPLRASRPRTAPRRLSVPTR
jgi:glycine/D-amino acid oxidase-like deaminating enzyme